MYIYFCAVKLINQAIVNYQWINQNNEILCTQKSVLKFTKYKAWFSNGPVNDSSLQYKINPILIFILNVTKNNIAFCAGKLHKINKPRQGQLPMG